MRLATALFLAAVLLSRGTSAQTAPELLARGIDSYQRFELNDAIGFLRRALEFPGQSRLSAREHADALSYLAAAQEFLGRRDSAETAFRRLVLHDPRYRPDELVFPPDVLTLFDAVRRATPVVRALVADSSEIRFGAESLAVRLHASAFHQVAVRMTRGDGSAFRDDLYTGPVSETFDLRWDGRDSTGAQAPGGNYLLAITSFSQGGDPVRTVQVPLGVTVTRRDTLPWPAEPADSLFLPERRSFAPAFGALLAGAALGGAAAALPRVLGGEENEANASRARYGVAIGLSVAGLAGFVGHRPGARIPANVQANAARRTAYQDTLQATIAENRTRREDIRLRIRAGRPTLTEY